MIPRTPAKGEFCIHCRRACKRWARRVANVSRKKGKRATATLLLAFGQLQHSVQKLGDVSCLTRSGPPAIRTSCRLADVGADGVRTDVAASVPRSRLVAASAGVPPPGPAAKATATHDRFGRWHVALSAL